jgi:subfamily B ATP-binding cassette protein MsbA
MKMADDTGPIGKIPIRGRLTLIRESLTYVPPKEGDYFQYRDILYFTRYLIPLKWPILTSLLLSFILSVLSSVLPLSSKWIIDYVFMKQSIQPVIDFLNAHSLSILSPYVSNILTSLPLIIGTLAIIEVGKYFISNELSLISYRINTEYGYRVKMDVFSRVMRFPISYFRSTRSGYLLARISTDTQALNTISSGFLQGLLTSSTTLLVSVTVLTSLSLPLTLFVMLSIPVTVGLNYYIIRFSRSFNIRQRESGLQISGNAQEMLSSIDLIKTHSAEDRELHRYASKLKENIDLSIASMLFGQVTGGMQRAISYCLNLLVMLLGGGLVLKGGMSIGDYTAFLTMYPQLLNSMTTYLQMPLTLQNSALSAGRVKELLDMGTEDESLDPKKPLIIPNHKIRGKIQCSHMYFAYENGVPVLIDTDLVIQPGERVAIIGSTGAGKTTFINLLLKFYQPQQGSILIDGYDLKSIKPSWIREQVGIVSQDLLLFDDTILNNIRYSRPDATNEEVYQVAQSAGIHYEIMAFPEQYNTLVGEKGAKLSGGQKQRIAIARAFLRDATIMILDEPTAHLDLETEEALMREFIRVCQGKTTIIISHRQSLLGIVDRVYELKSGKLSEK